MKKAVTYLHIALVSLALMLGLWTFVQYNLKKVEQKSDDLLTTEQKVSFCYAITEWSDCLEGGRRTRDVLEVEPKCKFIDEIKKPAGVESCEYIECTLNDYTVGEWGECVGGEQVRSVEKSTNSRCNAFSIKDKEEGTFDSVRACNAESKTKTTEIFGDYETLISPEEGNPYRANNNNFSIDTKGKIKNAKLVIKDAKTYVLGGEEIKIGADYYIMFEIGEDVPRALNAMRVDLGEGNTLLKEVEGKDGIFKGFETPKNLVFDLSDLTMARGSNETPFGHIVKNYLETLNSAGKKVGTIYLADGRSMTEIDKYKRIFGSIDAYIEYECTEDSDCSVKLLNSRE